MKLTARMLCVSAVLSLGLAVADNDAPEILRFSPTSGPEGTRVEIIGKNLRPITSVFFGANRSTFKLISAKKVIAIQEYILVQCGLRHGSASGV